VNALLMMLTSLVTTFVVWGMTHESGPVHDVWMGMKRVIERWLEPIFHFEAKEQGRQERREMRRHLQEVEAENERLKRSYRLLLDGTPGAAQDPAPSAKTMPTPPDLPIWGAQPRLHTTDAKQTPEFEQFSFSRDERFIGRLERDRDAAMKLANEQKKRFEEAVQEIHRLEREVGRMLNDGVLPSAKVTNDTTVTFSDFDAEYWKRKMEQSANHPKYGVVNRIKDGGGRFIVFIEFEARNDSQADGIARLAMSLQCKQDRCRYITGSLDRDSRVGASVVQKYNWMYRYRYVCQPIDTD
jgi:hypothetical protein